MKLMIDRDGTQKWYQNGELHRDDGPALIQSDGTQYWYKNNELHRDDGPALIYADGRQYWYKNSSQYYPTKEEFDAWEEKKRRLLVQQCGVLMKLSDRVRPNSEAAPWVIEEIEALESDLENAMQHFDMTMKAYQAELKTSEEDETLLRQALEALQWEYARTLVSLEIHKQDETLLRQALEALESVEPVAKVELMTTGGNAGLATRIVEIDDHLRERLRPGQFLYTAPLQRKLRGMDNLLTALRERLRDAWQTPTEVTNEIINSADPVQAYKDWVLAQSNDRRTAREAGR